MFRLPSLLSAALVVVTLLALTPIATRMAIGPELAPGRLHLSGGRVQRTMDEHDVGRIEPGSILEIGIVVTNVGAETLFLRQAPPPGSVESIFSTYIVSPGRTSSVIARLHSDDLAIEGRATVRFFTSDPSCPEFSLTVRGWVGEPE